MCPDGMSIRPQVTDAMIGHHSRFDVQTPLCRSNDSESHRKPLNQPNWRLDYDSGERLVYRQADSFKSSIELGDHYVVIQTET